jgi:hypothetical protein
VRALLERAEHMARAAQQRRVARLAEEWREHLPGATVTEETGGVAIAARGLSRRWLGDPVLRFLGRSR